MSTSRFIIHFSPSFSTIFDLPLCCFVSFVTKIDAFLLSFFTIWPSLNYGTQFLLSTAVFPSTAAIFPPLTEPFHPTSTVYPQNQSPSRLYDSSPDRISCPMDRCRFLQFSPPINPGVFSFFLVDLKPDLRYNIPIKHAIPQPNNFTFVQTGGNYHESQCQTRIHGPHHQF